MKLENRTILITGGSSGIDFALAKRLLEHRNVVIITGRSQEKPDSAKRALPAVHTFKSDLGDPSAIPALYDQVVEKFPALDTHQQCRDSTRAEVQPRSGFGSGHEKTCRH